MLFKRCTPPFITGYLVACAVAMLANAPSAWADAARGREMTIREADGATLTVRVWGDEFYRVVESNDGYTLVRDPATGFACYAELSADGTELVSTGIRATQRRGEETGLAPGLRLGAETTRRKRLAVRDQYLEEGRRALGKPQLNLYDAVPVVPMNRATDAESEGTGGGAAGGNFRGIVLLVDFPTVAGDPESTNDQATIPAANLNNFYNQVGYTGYNNKGSVRDYYYDVSNGALTLIWAVPTTYYRAKHPKSYYNDPNQGYGWAHRVLISEALDALQATGFNFSLYDNDGNGEIEIVSCNYAGGSEAPWANGLWPGAGWMDWRTSDGRYVVHQYQMQDIGGELSISTTCHEAGHAIMHWPDLYDYGYDSAGAGNWCIMAFGTNGKNPCEPCAPLKLSAGWSRVTQLTTSRNGVQVPRTNTAGNRNVAFKYDRPGAANEFYMIENRRKTARDAEIPGSGLAIWHVDLNGSNSNNERTPESHFYATLVQADGRWDMERNANSGDGTDLWSSPTYRQCTPATNPNTHWWDRTGSGLYVRNISAAADVMTFDYFTVGIDCNANGVGDATDIANQTSRDYNGNNIPDECDILTGVGRDCNANGRLDEYDLSSGQSQDCNANAAPDECEFGAQARGLRGQYFDDRDFRGLARERIDATVSFDWGGNAPFAEFGGDEFSARWTGFLKSKDAGDYTIFADSDDGVRVWINHQLVIDYWVDQATERSGVIALAANSDYLIVVEYYEAFGGARLRLSWQPPGGSKAIIPAENLYPDRDCNGNAVLDDCDLAAKTSVDDNRDFTPDECEDDPQDANLNAIPDVYEKPTPNGLAAAYFSNADLTGKREYRTDAQVSINWGTNEPFPGLGGDRFSVRWVGYLKPTVSGRYSLCTRSDDGSRLWLNGTLLVNRWQTQSGVETCAPVDLVAGRLYALRMEYFDEVGSALAELKWRPPGLSSRVIPSANLIPGLDCGGPGMVHGQPDLDGDDVIDFCDACPGTLAGMVVDLKGCPLPVPGDFDGDGDVDQTDFGHLQKCMTGSGVAQNDPACANARLDADPDVDATDVGIFRGCMSGSGMPGDPDCRPD